MHISTCIWALTDSEQDNLTSAASLGFRWIDIQPHMLATEQMRTTATEFGLRVSSVAASFGMAEGELLDGTDTEQRAAAIARMDRILAHGAVVDASAIYVVPGKDGSPKALARYASSLAVVAERAAKQGQKLCIEHFPGTALPTAAATLRFIEQIGHPNLYLLLDSGHLQMSNEDAETVINAAGPRLGYVHLDDNDGEGDLHWSLLDGVLTKNGLANIFRALAGIGYDGAVSIELHPQLADPLDAQRRSRATVLEVAAGYMSMPGTTAAILDTDS